MVQKRHDTATDDRTGFDSTRNYMNEALAKVVPESVARRAIDVRTSTDKKAYEPSEPVEITVEFDNRLPVPVEVPTPRRRRWGWEIDGMLEASDEKRYVRGEPLTFSFRAGETKTVTATWNGHFRRENDAGLDRSERAEPGDHTVTAFLAIRTNGERPEDSTTIRIV